MCTITIHPAGAAIPEEAITKAAQNNWHSYGLVTMVDGMLDIKRKVPESGEVDPDEVLRLLHDNRDYDRYLHLRHNTAGATTLENTHPFDVMYQSPKKQIVFMHNGTMHEYKSKTIDKDGKTVDDDTGPSDTKNFVEWILIPYTTACDFGNGVGDIEAFRYQQMIRKFWPTQNRGIVISAGQKPFLLGDWKKVTREKVEFHASNDDYFDSLKRGPAWSREEARKAQEKSKNKGLKGMHELARLDMFNFQQGKIVNDRPKPGFFKLRDHVKDIIHDYDLYDRQGCVALGHMTKHELEALHEDKNACVTVMEWAFSDYQQLYKEFLEEEDEKKILEDKLKRASDHIASLVKQVKSNGSVPSIG